MASTDTVPPAYNNDVDAPPAYTRDEKIAIQSGAAVELQKPEVKAKLQLDLNDFTKVIKEIDNSFRVVENKLGEIDSKKLGEAYQPKWVAFRKRYLELLSESQRTATTIATEAEKFDTFILPYATGKKEPSHSKEARLEEIEMYLEESKGFQEKADSLGTRFATLARDIDDFKNTFVHFADELLKKTTDDVAKLRVDIAGLTARMAELRKQLPLLIGAVGVIALGGVALSLIFPTFAGAIAKGALAVAGGIAVKIKENLSERKEKGAELAAKSAELRGKVATIGAIEQAREDLKILGETEIANIVNGISMISEIWRTVYDDCKQVESYLRITKKVSGQYQDDPDAPVVIASYLKSGCAIYSGLASALRAYAMGVSKPVAK